MLYVVHEKRLDGPLILLSVEPGVPSIDALAALAWGVTGSGCAGSGRAPRFPPVVAVRGCLFVGVMGLG